MIFFLSKVENIPEYKIRELSKCNLRTQRWPCNYTDVAIIENHGTDDAKIAKNYRPKEKMPLGITDLHLTLIRISFGEDKTIRIVKTATVTPVDIVSNVGGTLGLFSGFSILSGMEIVYWIIVWLFSKNPKPKDKKPIQVPNVKK